MRKEYVTDMQSGYREMLNSKQTLDDLKAIAEKNHLVADSILDEIMNLIEHSQLTLNLAEEHGLYKMIDVVRQRQLLGYGILANIIKRKKLIK